MKPVLLSDINSFTKNKCYAKKGESVVIISSKEDIEADHVNVVIVQGEREIFTVKKDDIIL